MSYRNLISWLTVFFWLTIGAAIAQQEVPELIEFDGAAFDEGGGSDIYPSAFTGPVKFSHSRHVEEYGAACGDCHHDSDFEPIDAHDPDETYACVECHDEEGLIRGPIAEIEASDSDLIAHRSNVIHMQCIGCHKQFNNDKQGVRAPESCIACHTKHPQNWVIN